MTPKASARIIENFVTPIQLLYQEKNNFITVIPEDEELFYLTVDKAIQACRAYNYTSAFSNQFQKLLDKLAQWIHVNKNEIESAFLTVRDAGLLFLVVRNSKKYNGQFEDKLTELDIEVAQDKNFDKIKLSVLAIPQVDFEQISSFLNPQASLRYNNT
jgi:hypothetical protein